MPIILIGLKNENGVFVMDTQTLLFGNHYSHYQKFTSI
jgi:hypothetical protein